MDFEIPEDVTALSGDALATAIESARAAGKAIVDLPEDQYGTEQADYLGKLMGFLTEAENKAEADKAAAEHAVQVRADALSKLNPETPAEPKVEETPEVTEPTGTAEVTETETEKEPVLASGSQKGKEKVLERLAKNKTGEEEAPKPRPLPVITAAADVPGFATGSKLTDLDQVAEGFIQRYQAMPSGKVGNVQNRYGVAQLNMQRTDGLLPENYRSMQDLLQAASVEKRLPGGSLTAAGGWCAPSETMYDLCSIESTDGLLDLPTVRAPRGGIQFTKGPNFEDFYAYVATAFQTEAEAEAGTVKTCIEVECPPFQEVRLDAAYACISAGILTEAAYPELIRRYVEGVLIAQQHAVSAKLIADAEAITGPAINVADVWANALSLLHALELVAEGERQRFRMARSATMEVWLPYWVRPALRADLANRTGVEMTNVTDAMLDAHFSNRRLRVQWLYNYQPLDVDTNGIATDYPDSIETIMYPAGTFVELTLDVIRLDAIYDSTGLSTNTYTAMFAEEGIALANVCHDPRRISMPFAVTGLTAAAIINQDFGEAPPAYTEA